MEHNTLSGALPAEIGGCAALQELVLGYNNFSGPVPSSLVQLRHLTQLELDHNVFSCEDVATIHALCRRRWPGEIHEQLWLCIEGQRDPDADSAQTFCGGSD